jgi:hypothetical protein
MAAWPGTLPDWVLSQGYGEKPPDQLLRSQVEQGPAKVRRRYTAAPRPVQVSIAVTAAQLETFDAFYLTTLEGGALTFDWQHPRTGVSKTFRFVKQPEYTHLGGLQYTVSMDLEIMP